MSSFVSQNACAGKEDRAKKAMFTGMGIGVIAGIIGHQKSFWVMLQGVLQTMIVRLPMAYIMSVQPHASLTMIGLASPCATTFGIVINVIYYMHTLKLEPVQQSVHA